jgi:hypothetical protein
MEVGVILGYKVILITPLARDLWYGHVDPQHVVNSENPTYAADMGRSLLDLTTNICNMIFMRKIKSMSFLNSTC